jgi:drug/metabolite transporter (DMT)-like permease
VFTNCCAEEIELIVLKIARCVCGVWQSRFVVMGLLDCLGTFSAAMGAVYTPGQAQTLLNQTLIPLTIAASWLYLGTRFTPLQLTGAAIVMVGAAIVSWGGGEGEKKTKTKKKR